MKIVHYFFLFLPFITLVNTNLDGMECQYDEEKITLRCIDLEEVIEIPKSIIKHSAKLSAHIKKFPFTSFYPIPVEISNQKILLEVIDCLKIIDSEDDVVNRLMNYIDVVIRGDDLKKLYDASCTLEIQKLRIIIEELYKSVEARRALQTSAYKLILDNHNKQLDDVIQQAKAVFEKIENKENSAIIIDVDDTALNRAQLRGKVVLNNISTRFPYLLAFDQVLILYKELIAMRFKMFFLTARTDTVSLPYDCYDATVKNLKDEGYDFFEQVICVSCETREKIKEQAHGDDDLLIELFAQWKESERNKIAATYTIAGTLDDTDKNLQGENVGHAVLIPRLF